MHKIIVKLCNSFKWSVAGFIFVFKNELSFRLELLAIVILTPLAMVIGRDLNQVFWLVGSVHLVVIIELLNTAIEKTIDRISLERNDLSRDIKDTGSAAVCYTILLATTVWGIIGYVNYIN